MNSYKKLFSIALLSLFLLPIVASASTLPPLPGSINDSDKLLGTTGGSFDLAGSTGLGNKDVRTTIGQIINVAMGLLGTIAVVIILIGGFQWMTAAGDDDKVGSAKKVLTAGIIGLAIVLAAFSITKFVVDSLISATVST